MIVGESTIIEIHAVLISLETRKEDVFQRWGATLASANETHLSLQRRPS